MNRRAFFRACGVLVAAPIAALATKFEPFIPEMAWEHDPWMGWSCQTLNGEAITGLEQVGDKLYAFTRTCVYEVPRVPENEPLWAFR